MKKALCLSMCIVLTAVLSLTFMLVPSIDVSAAGECFKVYPFDPYMSGAVLNMTPNGGYSFVANGGAALSFCTAVSNNKAFDYSANKCLHLYNVNFDTGFTVRADFNTTLDGYFAPSTVVYSTKEPVKEKLITASIYEKLNAAGKWNPEKGYLFISVSANHGGDATLKMSFGGIFLGGNAFSNDTAFAEPVAADMTAATVRNCSVIATADGYVIEKQSYSTTAELTLPALEPNAESHFVYINVRNIPTNYWPYAYISSSKGFVCGSFPALIRVRPEMGSSDVWMRIDLSEWMNDYSSVQVKLTFDTPGGEASSKLVYGGVYLGTALFGEELPDEEESSEESEYEYSEISENKPTRPKETTKREEESMIAERLEARKAASSSAEQSVDESAPIDNGTDDEESSSTTVIIICIGAALLCSALAFTARARAKSRKH